MFMSRQQHLIAALLSTGLLACASAAYSQIPQEKGVKYVVTKLTPSSQNIGFQPRINSIGQIAYSSDVPHPGQSDDELGFLWTPSSANGITGFAVQLPSLNVEPGNVRYDLAYGLDDSGDVVGSSFDYVGQTSGDENQADYIPYGAATATDLGTFVHNPMPPDPPLVGTSVAYSINDSEQVVGYAADAANSRVYSAFLWTHTSGLQNIGAAIGNVNSYAVAINNSTATPPDPMVVGSYGEPLQGTGGQGFAYDTLAGTYVTLPTYSGGAGIPTDINNAKVIVGSGTTTSTTHPLEYLTPASSPTDLNPYETGDMSAVANGIDNNNNVVGYAGTIAAIWYSDTSGKTIVPYAHYNSVTYADLNASNVVDPGYILSEVDSINDLGQIAGIEYDPVQGSQNRRALLLTPQFSGDLSAVAVKSGASLTLYVTVSSLVSAPSYTFTFGSAPTRFSPVSQLILRGATKPIVVTAPTVTTTQTVNITINNSTLGTINLPLLVMAPPTIKSVSPSHGAIGSTITITGAGLQYTYPFEFTGANASNYTVSTDGTTITAVVPTRAATGSLTVVTPGGSTSSTFTIP